jgi:hypothetical protein
MLFIVLCCAVSIRQEDVTDFYKGHLHFYEKRHSIMRKLDVGPTIDAASWRSVDGGVYARGPRGILRSLDNHNVSCESLMVKKMVFVRA